jgi:hypothetical protein
LRVLLINCLQGRKTCKLDKGQAEARDPLTDWEYDKDLSALGMLAFVASGVGVVKGIGEFSLALNKAMELRFIFEA